MKILHVIPSIRPPRGPSQAVLEMVWALRQQGVDATIVTTNDQGDTMLDVALHQWIDYPVGTAENNQTIPVFVFPKFSSPIASIQEFNFSFSLTNWLFQHIQEYDLIHIHAVFSYPSIIAMTLARTFHVPYIIRPLGSLAHWSLRQGARKKQLYLRLISRELKQTSGMHFTSIQEQQEAAALNLASSNFILPHGLTFPAVMSDAKTQLCDWLNLPPCDPVILFLSRLHPKKGLEVLIQALEQLNKQRGDQCFQLVIAGSGSLEYETEIDRCITMAGIQARTHRVGFVTGDRKQLLLQGADLFALPSHSENFGIVVLEALGAGLPVLITPEVALADWVKTEQVGWVVPQDARAIAQALQDFIQCPTLAQAMGERAIQNVRSQFTWPSVVRQLIDRYATIIQPTAELSISSSTPSADQPC
ncbi:MAG: glycosyltransferase [Alkalinema sp. RU_4_3]|nr:glycosyltransferase [Alkalinema sp. RU_4_3]